MTLVKLGISGETYIEINKPTLESVLEVYFTMPKSEKYYIYSYYDTYMVRQLVHGPHLFNHLLNRFLC